MALTPVILNSSRVHEHSGFPKTGITSAELGRITLVTKENRPKSPSGNLGLKHFNQKQYRLRLFLFEFCINHVVVSATTLVAGIWLSTRRAGLHVLSQSLRCLTQLFDG